MSRWAEPIKEFHQLVTPDGQTYDLHTPSRNGRWVMNSQGWGMPGVDWITQQSPFQHGATVVDYRLQPRTLQLMVRQNYCNREAYWTGREALINALRPNRTPLSFIDQWLARSQYQGGGVYPSGSDQTKINDLAVFNDLLYGCSDTDAAGTGGILMVWDGAGSWVNVASQATLYSTALKCLETVTMTLPVFSEVLGTERPMEFYSSATAIAGYLIYAENYRAQTFTMGEECVLASIRLWLYRVGTIGTVYVGVYATDGSGHPTGDALTIKLCWRLHQ